MFAFSWSGDRFGDLLFPCPVDGAGGLKPLGFGVGSVRAGPCFLVGLAFWTIEVKRVRGLSGCPCSLVGLAGGGASCCSWRSMKLWRFFEVIGWGGSLCRPGFARGRVSDRPCLLVGLAIRWAPVNRDAPPGLGGSSRSTGGAGDWRRFGSTETSFGELVARYRWCGMLPRGDFMKFAAHRVRRSAECLDRGAVAVERSLRRVRRLRGNIVKVCRRTNEIHRTQDPYVSVSCNCRTECS